MSPFYTEVKNWIAQQLERRTQDKALVIGVSAPQGAGKTTLTDALVESLENDGLSAISVSIDDFYLTHDEQVLLASKNPKDPTLQQRGYPGTHDLKLGIETIEQLVLLGDDEILIPRYDKSAHQGAGDRAPKSKWSEVEGPLDVILFEGWMLGFDIPEYHAWWSYLDALIYLRAKDHRYVLDWRVEAEQKMKALGKTGMTDEQVLSYAQKFMPAYEKWSASIPQVAKQLELIPDRYFEKIIGKDRQPIK